MSASIIPDDEPCDPVADALAAFRAIMWNQHEVFRKAELLSHRTSLPPLYGALAQCVVKLSGLRPHQVRVGELEADDFAKLKDNLEHVVLAVDPLIRAFGEHVRRHARGAIDISEFTDVLRKALDGRAFYEIEGAADRAAKVPS